LLSSLEAEWIGSGYVSEEQESQFKNKAQEILTTYLEDYQDSLNKIAYIEHPFTILENGVRVEGKMDRVDKLPSGELRIIDFKVGESKEPGPWEVFQLQLYALACERTLDAEVADCRFQFLTSNDALSVEFNDRVREKSLNRLRNVIKQMKAREYEPDPGNIATDAISAGSVHQRRSRTLTDSLRLVLMSTTLVHPKPYENVVDAI